jgi:hypothetical protein
MALFLDSLFSPLPKILPEWLILILLILVLGLVDYRTFVAVRIPPPHFARNQ